MNTQSKKNIAREFLVLMITVVAIFITICTIYIKNVLTQKEIKNLENKIIYTNKLSDSLKVPYETKATEQETLVVNLYLHLNVSVEDIDDSRTNLWRFFLRICKNDSVHYYWDNDFKDDFRPAFIKYGITDSKQLKQYVLSNVASSSDLENYRNSLRLKDEEVPLLKFKLQKEKRNLINKSDSYRYIFYVFIICFLITFVLRYIIYGIRWSLKTLKSDTP